MRYFLDTEFMESGPDHPVHLVSIGIVAEDGREYYAYDADAPLWKANEFVVKNVIPNLGPKHFKKQRGQIAKDLREFVGNPKVTGSVPEFWGAWAAYDWVVFCQIFGDMSKLPDCWPYHCNDLMQLKQTLRYTGALPAQVGTEHNALDDARWHKAIWEALTQEPVVIARL